MNANATLKRVLAMFTALALCFTFVPWQVFAADATGVAQWSYTAAPESGLPATATGGVDTDATLDVVGAAYTGYSSRSLAANNWTEGAYWLITLDTTGYENLTFSAQMRASNTGPANFKLQYLIPGGEAWVDVDGGAVTITSTSLSQLYTDLVLPAAVNDVAGLKLRLMMENTTSVNGGTVAATGAANVNNIVISGTAISSGETPSEDPTEDTTEVPTTEEVTTEASSTEESTGDGSETTVPTLADGKYVFHFAASGKGASALEEAKTYGYLPAADMTVTDGVVASYTAKEIFTVTNTTDGKFTLTDCYGRKLYMSGTYNSFNVSAAPNEGYEWYLKDLGDGTYNLVNAAMEKYVQYTTYGNFGSYNYENGDGVMKAIPVTPVVADGTYVIYAPDSTKALSALEEAKTYGYLPAADITLTDGAVTAYTNNELFTVTNIGGGKFTLTDCYGRQLYMTGTYNSFNVSAAPNEGYEWYLKDLGDGSYNLVNAAMEKYVQYTTYGNFGSYNYENGDGAVLLLAAQPIAEEEEPTDPPVEETGYTWTQVSLDEIQPSDVIAVTMTKGDTTWALFSGNGTGSAPTAVVVTVDGTTMTSEVMDTLAWNIASDDNGLILYVNGTTDSWLYSSNANNGVRVGTNDNQYWVVDEASGYLMHVATSRYLGVYTTNPDWRAYTNTTGNTAGQTLTFWKLNTGSEEEGPAWETEDESLSIYELVGSLTDGDTVVMFNPGNGKAVSSQFNSYYLSGVDATVTDGYIASDADYIEWTVSVQEGEAGKIYTFTQGDLILGILQNGTYFNLKTGAGETTDTGWYMAQTAEGSDQYYIWSSTLQGTYGNVYLEWYANKNGFSPYSTGNTSETNFGFSFYKLVREGVPGEEEEQPVGIADGDYVIWAPAYNMALSSTYPSGSYYNAGVTVSMDGETLTGYGSTEIWTVTNNEDGTITISYGGQNLALAASYSSMTLGEVNDTWTLEAAGDGLWYVKNVGRDSYIEWYDSKSYWSCYYNIASGSEGMFALQFTPAEAVEEPTTAVADGDYVIWAPAYNKALSSVYGGYYNNGVDVTLSGETLTGYGNTEIWTVTNNDDGTVTISYGGQALGMADSFSSMTLGEKHNTWTLENAGNGLWYVKNVGRGAYIEWYAANGYWSGYYNIASGSEGMFALRFTPAERTLDTDSSIVENIAQWGGMTHSGNTASVNGDLYTTGDELDTQDVFTAVVSGNAVTPWTKGGSNDAPLYYMGGAGIGSGSNDYLQFAVNASGWGDLELSFRLRASNSGPGSFQLMYSVDNGATWVNFTDGSYAYAYTGYDSNGSFPVTGEGSITDGIARTSLAPAKYVSFVFDVPAGASNCGNLLIRLVPGTEKAKGDGAISASGTVRVDCVALSGSPVLADTVAKYVTVTPNGEEDQPIGTELTMISEEGAVIYYRVNGGTWQTYSDTAKPTLDTLPCYIEAYASVSGKTDSPVLMHYYAAGTVATVKLDPSASGIYIPEGETQTVTLTCATEGATVWYMVSADGEVWPETWTEYTEGAADLVLNKGFGKYYVRAYATKEGFNDSGVVERAYTERATSSYSLYFGQLHSHTNISDGSGTIEEAFAHAYNVDNLDFLAVTDHSNSFDNAGNGVLAEDASAISNEWKQAQLAAYNITDETFVGLYGYEMTWSNGLGHMNTFNTPGFQSRTQTAYSSYGTALQNYYAALATVPGSISQFNHPGTTFGDFSDFAHYSEGADALITLIEVGNGEGAIGSSGYFPSYEYYTRALDKGWHVAPTNNQDNHKGNWGDSNTGRTVVMADSLTAEGIYDALRNYRVYATEDNDLNIYYTLNGSTMGSILSLETGDELTLTVKLSDATDSSIGKVEVIVNGGLSAASATVSGNSDTVTFTLDNNYSYYYIKVTQTDGDIAVTAPVWTGAVEACGISAFTTDAPLPVQNQEMNLSLDLYNNESVPMELQSIQFSIGDEVIHTADLSNLSQVDKLSTASYTFTYTYAGLGETEILATVTGTLNGVTKVYQAKLTLTFVPDTMVTRVVVDGTHYNDYVTGYYGGNMGNLAGICAENQIEVNVVTDTITAEILADCDLLIISAPARFSGTANAGDYTADPFEDSFIQLVADYVKDGGSVIICGLADYQDRKASSADLHAAAQLNKLLEAMGSTMRIHDDQAMDDTSNGGQAYRLYPSVFNTESPWCAGISSTQTYSQYSGCTVDVGSGTWLVKGFDTTYSADSDNDGQAVVGKGEAVFLACEDTPYGGTVFAAGGVFMSNFEVQAELDNIWSEHYANRTIIENILGAVRTELPLSTIAQVRAGQMDEVFRIRGYVTAGTTNPDTTFFDAIYVQDETGGITVFPFSQTGLVIGTPIEIIGYVDAYQGDREIQIISYTILDAEAHIYQPELLPNAQAMDYAANGGKLIQVEGQVVEVLYSGETGVAQFVVKDSNGDLAKVFIDGYILSGTTGKNELASIVKVGNTVSAVGLLYMHPEGDSEESVAVLRVRDCDEIVLISEAVNAITITQQPVSVTAAVGTRVSFTVKAEAETELTYQWQFSRDGETWENSPLFCSVTDTLAMKATGYRNAMLYRCVISDAAGNSVTSDAVSLTATGFLVKHQPQDAYVMLDGHAKFAVVADAAGIRYQWQFSRDGETWENSPLTASTTAKLSMKATAYRSGMFYRCVLTNVHGEQFITDVVKLNTTTAITVTRQPISQFTALDNQVNLTVEAEGNGLQYQWQFSLDGYTWENSPLTCSVKATLTFKATAYRDGMYYRCVITDADGNKVITNEVTLTVN